MFRHYREPPANMLRVDPFSEHGEATFPVDLGECIGIYENAVQ
jgi:hypothetical protein